MAATVKVKLDLPSADKLIDSVGIGPTGLIQRFHTQNVLRRIQKYMPYKTGAFIKTTVGNTNIHENEIVSVGPHAAYLYYGKVMVNAETGKGPGVIPDVGPRYRKGTTLKATDRDLEYDTSKNPHAGPFWDRTLLANESDILVSELQDYINYLARRNT